MEESRLPSRRELQHVRVAGWAQLASPNGLRLIAFMADAQTVNSVTDGRIFVAPSARRLHPPFGGVRFREENALPGFDRAPA